MRPPFFLFNSMGRVLPILTLAIVLVGLLLFVVRARRGSRERAFRSTGLDIGMAVWLGLILLGTVVPFGGEGERPPISYVPFLDTLQRIVSGEKSVGSEVGDIVLNVLLFAPLGIGAALRWGRSWRTFFIVTAAALSMSIELTQAIQSAGRFASITDVFDNTLGAALGFALGLQLDRQDDGRVKDEPTPDRTIDDEASDDPVVDHGPSDG